MLFLVLALRPRGRRARWTKSQVVLESSHAEHGLRLSHRIFRLLQRSQLSRGTCSIDKKSGVFKRIKCERCEIRAQLEVKGMSPEVRSPLLLVSSSDAYLTRYLLRLVRRVQPLNRSNHDFAPTTQQIEEIKTIIMIGLFTRVILEVFGIL
jgi:hypothetical protein